MTITVHRAERRKAKLRLAITGPSGSGKTLGALYVAKGLVGPNGRILIVDTEHGSSNLYDRLVGMPYDVAEIDPPYLTEKYIEAIGYAENNGYDCIILDSISHAWNGQGGILSQKDTLAERTGNSFTSWAKLTPKQDQFIDAILSSRCHVIATMRSKTEYVLVQDASGRSHPEKRAMAPIQRDGIDYEFTIVFDVAANHTAEATKDRSGMFADSVFCLSEETGRNLRDWLESGTEVSALARVCPICGRPSMTEAEALHMEHLAETKEFDHDLCKDCSARWYNERKKNQVEKTEIEKKATHPIPQQAHTEMSEDGQKVLDQLLASAKAAEEKNATITEAKPSDVCSICGKKMSKGELSAWRILNRGQAPVCADCADKHAGN